MQAQMDQGRGLGIKTGAPKGTPWAQVFFSGGFRPFFFAVGLWGLLAIPLWMAYFTGLLQGPGGLDPLLWHSHEMLFGFVPAAIAGFLLTAIPNWTGRLPIKGKALAFLFGLWLLGRAAWLSSAFLPAWAIAAADLSFLGIFWLATLREVVAGKNWRNLAVLAPVGLLFIANVLIHIENIGLAATADWGQRLGIAVVAFLVTLIGGRITPSFTRNWLARNKAAKLPAPMGRFDKLAILSVVVALIGWVGWPQAMASAWLALFAGVMLLGRLARWRGVAVWRDVLLLVLHLSYGWLALAFLLLGLTLLGENGVLPISLPHGAAIHAFTAGAFANMILAVMSRATLGHSGLALRADGIMVLSFAALFGSALLRLAAAWQPSALFFGLSAALWAAAFALFLLRFHRLLFLDNRPRPRA
tara:strand:+ start:494 stop:1738 length:1245 start_codon:yes stop_codon:yes gene_type:complete